MEDPKVRKKREASNKQKGKVFLYSSKHIRKQESLKDSTKAKKGK